MKYYSILEFKIGNTARWSNICRLQCIAAFDLLSMIIKTWKHFSCYLLTLNSGSLINDCSQCQTHECMFSVTGSDSIIDYWSHCMTNSPRLRFDPLLSLKCNWIIPGLSIYALYATQCGSWTPELQSARRYRQTKTRNIQHPTFNHGVTTITCLWDIYVNNWH